MHCVHGSKQKDIDWRMKHIQHHAEARARAITADERDTLIWSRREVVSVVVQILPLRVHAVFTLTYAYVFGFALIKYSLNSIAEFAAAFNRVVTRR